MTVVQVPVAAPTRMGAAEAEAVREAIDRVVSSDWWILGDEVARFEAAFAQYVGAAAAVGVANGTDALTLAMLGLGLERGDSILVPANDGGYAALAALRVGLIPQPMDVDAATGLVGIAQVKSAWKACQARALVITHLHGRVTPLDDIDRWRKKHGLVLLEDCAQAHGIRVDGRHVGGVGEAATFSFYPTKNLGAVGDGGAVTFAHDLTAAERVRRLRQYGWGAPYEIEIERGFNSRLDALQAAVLGARLPFLDARNERRQQIGSRLREAASASGLRSYAAEGVFHHFVVLSEQRNELREFLSAHGVSTAIHYPAAVGDMPGLGSLPSTPVASAHSRMTLSLPCFPEMTQAEVDHVESALRAWGAAHD